MGSEIHYSVRTTLMQFVDNLVSNKAMRLSDDKINLVEAFRENVLLITSDELRTMLFASNDLRALLLIGLSFSAFDSSKISKQFIEDQQLRMDSGLSIDNDYSIYQAYQLLRNQDQQGAEPVEGSQIKIRKPDIEKLVRDHKMYCDWDFLVFEEINLMSGTTQERKVEQFCSIYNAPSSIISPYKKYQTREFSEGIIRPRRTSKKKV